MQNNTRKVVIGVFHDPQNAQLAVDELRSKGYGQDLIGMVGRHIRGEGAAVDMHGNYAGEGAAAGVVAGASVGGLWAIGIAAGLLPAVGPVIAGGVLASLLASAATGAAAGGLIGALIGMGIPEDEAQFYESEFHSGRILVTVQADGRWDEAAEILRKHGAYDVHSAPRTTLGASTLALDSGSTLDVPADREEIHLDRAMHEGHRMETETGQVPTSDRERGVAEKLEERTPPGFDV